ncbi:MAG: alpha/beta fold hydrolase [Dermatophilaceae bacterium]
MPTPTCTPSTPFAGLAGDLRGTADTRAPLVLLHGVSFDRTLWEPALRELELVDPGRQVLTLDLPGHGESPDLDTYPGERIGTAVYGSVQAAGLTAPIIVGHSYSGLLATMYAARFPVRGVVNVDQTLLVAPFLHYQQSIAGQLRGPQFPTVWQDIAASMHPELLDESGQRLVADTCRPRQQAVVGYWQETLDRPGPPRFRGSASGGADMTVTAALGTATLPVQCHSLSRAFGKERAVDDVSVQVRPGEVHALVGLNGAGKTTLMRLLLAMLRPDSGEVRLFGSRVAAFDGWGRVGCLLETPFAYPELTVRQNLYAAVRLRGLARRDAPSAVEQVLDLLVLGSYAGRPCRALSLGNRQRVGLACALVHGPDLLVLDEPTNALDPAGVVLMRDLVRRQADEHGVAVLVSSHHLDEVARIAHRITVLHRGRVIATLDPHGIDLERQFFSLVHAADAEQLGAVR